MSRWFDLRFLISSTCLLGLLLACFGSVLSPGRQLAYRDFSDFYYPLYQRVQQEWEKGRLPLWDHEENCGSPLLGNPTAAVLYPGKLIYAVLPYPVAAKAYVIGHIVLAFAAMVSLLRHWEVSLVGSTVGGLAYGFGGPVLTQYCNVVFLVGAAWMPLGFRFADGWIRLGQPLAIVGLAFVLMMQLLGGDPEAAYLTAFASVTYALGRWVGGDHLRTKHRIVITMVALISAYSILALVESQIRPVNLEEKLRNLDQTGWHLTTGLVSLVGWLVLGTVVLFWRSSRGEKSNLRISLIGLVGACVLALATSSVQLIPTLEFIGQSTRSSPSNFIDIYMQSIHPARVAEWFYPNLFGSTFGLNRNWLTALPPTADHYIWMNSIYLGGFTILLASGAVFARTGPLGRGWMVGLALAGVLGGFGDFGSPILWARAMPGGEARFGTLEDSDPALPRADGALRDGDGGVYWFISSVLPGFRSFRYPGKLFIPGSLGICALAGMGFDGLIAGRRKTGLIVAWLILIAGIVSLSTSFLQPSLILNYLEGRAELARSGFGPFDSGGALIDLRIALVHGSIVLGSYLILVSFARQRPKLVGILVLSAVSFDLAMGNRGQIGTVSQAIYEQEPRTLAAIEKSERENPEQGPFRVFRLHAWAPKAWNQAGATDRLDEMIRWERDTLRSKYELPLGVSSTFAFGTAEIADLAPFFQPFPVSIDRDQAQRMKIATDQTVSYYPRRGFDLWNTRYFILPTRMSWTVASRGFASLLPGTESIYPRPFVGPDTQSQRELWATHEDVQVVKNREAFPRAWVVHRVIPVAPTTSLTPASKRKLMTSLLYQDDELWHIDGMIPEDLSRMAHVEAQIDQLSDLAGARDAAEPVRFIKNSDPTRVELEVTLESPGLVILSDIFYPGWTLEVDGKTTEILRTNRAMRGAVVNSGKHSLIYTYRPQSLKIGFAITVLGFVAMVCLFIFGMKIEINRRGTVSGRSSDRS